MLDLIFAHVGKTGGSSIARALVDHYGAEGTSRIWSFGARAVARDDLPGQVAGKRLAYGHLRIADFDDIPSRFRITFLRDPVDRLISLYFYFLGTPARGSGERKRIHSDGAGILDFARSPRIATAYSERYFGGYDMSRFDLIGRFENFADDISRIETLIGASLPVHRLNPSPDPDYAANKAAILGDPHLMAGLREVLAADIEFYENHVPSARV
ncbi:MAG: sulfotransferase family 2 domain-containing protein [Hansschlegelia sp.]